MANTNQRNLTTTAIILLVLLLLSNAYLLYRNYDQRAELDRYKLNMDKQMDLNRELEVEYHEAIAELEQMRGDNEQLNQFIDEQQADLKTQKDHVARLIKDSRALDQAKEELNQLRAKVDSYISKVSELESQLSVAKDSLQRSNSSRMILTQKIAEERILKDSLKYEQEELSKENQKLEQVNQSLNRKVNIASVLQSERIEVEGYKISNNGKMRMRKNAKHVQGLKICFVVKPNPIAKDGEEEMIVRIIDPSGKTIAIESMGSGVLHTDQEDIRFTKTMLIKHSKTASTENCTTWDSSMGYSRGVYQVELYNKGILSGASEFELN